MILTVRGGRTWAGKKRRANKQSRDAPHFLSLSALCLLTSSLRNKVFSRGGFGLIGMETRQFDCAEQMIEDN